MGGFYLTNKQDGAKLQEVIELFSKKEMKEYELLEVDDYKVIYFSKINNPQLNGVYRNQEDFAFGVGVYFYKSAMGTEALEKLYLDIKETKDYSLFRQIKGHFNLVFAIDKELMVVSDKTGSYHSFISQEEGKNVISSSLYAVLANLEKVHLNKQELMEFMLLQCFFDEKTPFAEINYLGFSQVHKLGAGTTKESSEYMNFIDLEGETTLEEQYENIVSYLEPLKKLEITLTTDITGGFDSRLVTAILKHLDFQYVMSTNPNTEDKTDLEVALEIAEGEKKELKIYEKDMTRINEELINQAFTKNELVRDNFRGAYSSVFFDEKSKDFEMVIGGYGGELYRDVKYKGMKTIDLLIQSQYTLRAIEKVFKKEELENYYANIKGKMRKFLKQDHDELDQLKAFKIYYFMKMMYWGGSRISMFNQYCYRYHPLLDYDLVPMVFTVPDSLQKNNKFNMKIIERFDEDMSKYMSSYGYNFEWEEKKITVVNKKITIFDKLRMLKRKLGIGVTKTEWKKMLKKPLLLPQIVELKKEIFEKETTLGSVYAIEKLLESINEKIIWEK